MIEQTQKEKKLKALGFSHLLEFVICAPSDYVNTLPMASLQDSTEGVLEVEILRTNAYPNVFKVQGRILDFDEYIELVFFHPKAFHKKLFPIGQNLFIHGKLSAKFGQYTMIQPKVIKHKGSIVPVFKSIKYKSNTIKEALDQLITKEGLSAYGLDSRVIEDIVEIFHPNLAFFDAYTKHNGFFGKYLSALKYVEVFYHFLSLQGKKTTFQAKFQCGGDYKAFINSLPFALTNAQNRVIAQIANDLSSQKAARRLVMGDVGCGKTIIILASVMIAYPQKSILMAPTTILAKQLYEQAKLYLPKQIQIALITSDSKDELSGLFGRHIDFIIGTQALLYREIDGEDLALVMSDEQHRFGTKQRFYLESLATQYNAKTPQKPHILQFSATPIPRTMAMLESNLIDVSIIDEMPFMKDISTQIISKPDFKELLAHIKNEIAKNHQIAIIYPLVEESQVIEYLSLEEGALFWQKHFERVYVTSGQDKQKEQIMPEFADNGNILLATTLIEVGISLPKLSTIIIIAPERLGLATLHQLRGRVSRNGLKGYCFLYTHNPDSKRLADFATHSSGFDIAEIDLKYRKGGDILGGKRQSGQEWKWVDLSQDVEIFNKVKSDIAKIKESASQPESKTQNV